MRWTFRISFLLFLAWAIFMVSPFVGLYDLGKAVEARDLNRITERVNFNALRTSLTKQVLREYMESENLDEVEQDFAAQAGAAVLNPVIEELVNPQALVDLLEDGWPQRATVDSGTTVPPLRLDFSSFKQAWQTFITSESQGFRAVTIPLPANVSKDRQFRLTMRLRNTTWRLSGIELPVHLRDELARRAAVASHGTNIQVH